MRSHSTPVQTPPFKPLLLLSLAVLLAHLWLLRGTALHLTQSTPAVHRFSVRTLPLSAANPAAPTSAKAPAAAQATTVSTAIASPARASNSPDSATNTTSASQPKPSHSPSSPAPLTLALPDSMRLNYTVHGEVRMLRFDSQASLQWQHDGQRYDAQFNSGAQLQGTRVQSSQGLITPQGLRPMRFADKLRSEVAAHFEHEQQRISFSANTPDALLQADAQDQLSMVVQLAAWAKAEPERFAPGNTLALQVASAREADVWLFVVVGQETVHTPLGDMPSIKLTRAPQKNFDVRLTLWLAPALSYLPARMRWTQMNGDTVEQLFSGLDKPAAP